jgi:hypothetical protein
MTQHMQQNMPAHLKKYVGDNAAYVPKHMEAQVAQQMQKNMPSHLKQYAGAYMQQQVMQPNVSRLHGPQSDGPRPVAPHAPLPDKLRRGHSMPVGEQHTVELNTLPNDKSLFQADQPAASSTSQGPPVQPYDFIMNPEQQLPGQPGLPGSNSPLMRILIIGGLIVVLIIAFVVIKSMLGGSSNLPKFVAVAQDQQEMIHITSIANQQATLSTENQNFSTTAQLSLSSAQSDLLKYLKANHQKVSVKQLNLKVSRQVDTELQNASAATTYNQTFNEIMQAQLSNYMSQLKAAYQTSESDKGRALLNDQYTQAQLLQDQLKAASTSSP